LQTLLNSRNIIKELLKVAISGQIFF